MTAGNQLILKHKKHSKTSCSTHKHHLPCRDPVAIQLQKSNCCTTLPRTSLGRTCQVDRPQYIPLPVDSSSLMYIRCLACRGLRCHSWGWVVLHILLSFLLLTNKPWLLLLQYSGISFMVYTRFGKVWTTATHILCAYDIIMIVATGRKHVMLTVNNADL